MTGEGVAGFRMTVANVFSGLWLIGIGPGNLQQMTLEAKEIAIRCSRRYLEGYTAILPKDQEDVLENIVGAWEKVMREEIENPRKILDEAKNEAVCILVVGDPMQATTHVDLEMHCHDEGIEFNIGVKSSLLGKIIHVLLLFSSEYISFKILVTVFT